MRKIHDRSAATDIKPVTDFAGGVLDQSLEKPLAWLFDLGSRRLKWQGRALDGRILVQGGLRWEVFLSFPDLRFWLAQSAMNETRSAAETVQSATPGGSGFYAQESLPNPVVVAVVQVAGVAKAAETWWEQVRTLFPGVPVLQALPAAHGPLGLRLGYAAHQFGADRYCGLLGVLRRSRSPAVVIDAGTAVTIDFLATGGVHRGGYILPGFGLGAMAVANLLSPTLRQSVEDALQSRSPGRQARRPGANLVDVDLTTPSALVTGGTPVAGAGSGVDLDVRTGIGPGNRAGTGSGTGSDAGSETGSDAGSETGTESGSESGSVVDPAICFAGEASDPEQAPGTGTVDALWRGWSMGLAGAIECLCTKMCTESASMLHENGDPGTTQGEECHWWIAGGDAQWLAGQLTHPVHCVPDLVMDGLWVCVEAAGWVPGSA